MTVTTTTTYSELVGNGTATAFPFMFAAPSADEVRVSLDGVVQLGGYTIALASSGTGGTVTFDTAPANDVAVLIESDPDFTQESSFGSEGDFNPATFDRIHDRLTTYALWLKQRVSWLFPSGSILPSSRAGRFLAFDAMGEAALATGTGADAGLRTDLAASGGGALVNYTPSGTGSAARSLQDKAREVVSTADYTTFAGAVTNALIRGLPILVNENRALAANTTAAVRLIAGGGIITTGAYTLTVTAIDGPEIPLFDKAGTGAITLSSDDVSRLGWFAPTGDGVADDTNPITRWLNSSARRETVILGTFLTATQNVPTRAGSKSTLIGAGINFTQFKSKTGADIFVLPGVNIGGLYYVNFLEMGGFIGLGQGRTTGSGYVVRVPSSVSTGYNNFFYDIDSDVMGGGTFNDEPGLFSTEWNGLRGGNCGNHVFNMNGSGPGSVMRNCYARNALAGKAGFRVIYQNLELNACNGLNVDTDPLSFWGIFGASLSATTINVTSGGSVTIPADPLQVSSNVILRHCNVEAFPDVGILALNGTVRMDEGCTFQTKAGNANCVAIYCTNDIGLGLQGTLPPVGNFVLVAGATWAQSCPIWVHDTTPAFAPPVGDAGNASINLRDYTDGVTVALSAFGAKYLGQASLGRMEAHHTNALSTDLLKLTPQTPASAAATGVQGEIAIDAGYVYVCTATNTWKRAALASW